MPPSSQFTPTLPRFLQREFCGTHFASRAPPVLQSAYAWRELGTWEVDVAPVLWGALYPSSSLQFPTWHFLPTGNHETGFRWVDRTIIPHETKKWESGPVQPIISLSLPHWSDKSDWSRDRKPSIRHKLYMEFKCGKAWHNRSAHGLGLAHNQFIHP